MAEVEQVRGKYENRIAGLSPASMLDDQDLVNYSMRSGKVLFGDNCAACHGPNGIGVDDDKGYMAPILNDDDWLFGGKIDQIYASISDGRMGMMMAFDQALTDAELDELAQALAVGDPTSSKLFTQKGCSGCHGADATGMHALGSANLTDQAWRFDGSVEGIKYTLKHGINDTSDPMTRGAVMPGFAELGKLSENDRKKLAVYVYQLGGGISDKPVVAEPEPAPVADEPVQEADAAEEVPFAAG